MSAAVGYRVGRAWLEVARGSAARLFLHDIAESPGIRRERLHQAQHAGAWTYVQRGHAPSSCSRGGVYRISEFTLDLLRLLRDVVAAPMLVTADGASGLVAALAAAVEPGWVGGLCLLPASGDGWGTRPDLLVGDESEPNVEWFSAIQVRRGVRPDEDDPALRPGPPETMPTAAVAAALSGLTIPWAAPSGHFLERWIPAQFRASDDVQALSQQPV